MSFTKVTSAGIGSTELVTLDSLEVINNASIGGVLTYEDVTNVDSIGIITARAGVLVGSGITLSKDGDIFATGVTTSTTFVGALTGNVTGNVSGSSGSATGNAGGLTGTPNISVGTIAGSTGTFTGDVDIADKIVHTGDTNTAIRFPAADTVSVETSGSETLRLNSTGQILVGTTSDGGSYDGVTPKFVSEANSAYHAYSFVVNSTNAGHSGILQFVRSRGTSDGANTIVQDGDRLGSIYGIGADGTNRDTGAAAIDFRVDGTPGENDMPGRIEFRTTADGAASPTERLRITSSGKLGVGNNNPSFLLDLKATSSADVLRLGNTAESNHGNADVKIVAGGSYYQNFDFQASTYKFQTYNGSSLGERVRITSDGKFGVGLTSPTGKFAVSDGTVIGEINPYSSSSTCFIGTRSNHSVTLKTNATGRLTISTDGYVTKPATPFFSVYGTGSNQTYNDGDIIDFENVTHNVGSHFKTTSGTGQYERFIAPVAGVYMFTFAFFPNSASNCRIQLAVNGSGMTNPYISGCFTAWGTGSPVPSGSQMLKLSASDYVDVRVSGGTLTNTYDGHTGFQGFLLG